MALTIRKIKKLFKAETVQTRLQNQEIKFLEERFKIKKETPCFLRVGDYLELYPIFKKYALDKIMIRRAEPDICYMCNFEPLEFSQGEFYRRFKNEKLVQKHFKISKLVNKSNL